MDSMVEYVRPRQVVPKKPTKRLFGKQRFEESDSPQYTVPTRMSVKLADLCGLHVKEFRAMKRCLMPGWFFTALAVYNICMEVQLPRDASGLDVFGGVKARGNHIQTSDLSKVLESQS